VHLGGRLAKPHGRPAMSCGLPALDKFPSGPYRLAKPHGRPAMSCGLPALDKFPSGPYASRKYVVMLGHAVMVSKLW
jgi:hypothetical protein